MKSVLAEELELISLSSNEVKSFEKIAKDFIKSLKSEGVRAYIGGSLAKGTMVKKSGKQDVDVFVVFDYSEDIGKLEGILGRVDLPGSLKKVHGSRDYFQVDCSQLDTKDQTGQGCLLEVIPVVKNSDPELAENVTDVSLSHVKYVGGEVKKNPGIADEIKLAKAFARAQGCYGAESYVKGFSGYSLEVLVIYFGGFVKFLKGISRKSVIDPLKYFRSDREVMNEINASKLHSPIVLVDPTYKYRNVCAGLGFETYEKFVEISKDFLKSPSLDFFVKKDLDVSELEKFALEKKARFLKVDLSTDRQEGDIAGTKMRKLLDFFARELERKWQNVLRKDFDYGGIGQRAMGYIVVREVKELEIQGPSVGLQDCAEAFTRANKGAYKKKGFWFVKKKVSVEEVFELVKKVEKEMGAKAELSA
jgi:tRNA nucleotidyltransferase (CCA-adding enzyme)